MRFPTSPKRWATLGAVTIVYFLAARLSFGLAFVNQSATPVWPPTGITLAAILLIGYDVWPAIFAGAFFANLATAGTIATSLAIAGGNTLEGLVAAYLVHRYAHGARALDRAEDVVKLSVFAAVVSTMVSATIGVTALALSGLAHWSDYGAIWFTWWMGDSVGDLALAPAILLWSSYPRVDWKRGQILEAAGLLAGLGLVALIVFSGFSPTATRNYPLEFLCTPLMLWVAYRFGPRETATSIVGLSAAAIWGTLHGHGPFVRDSQNMSLLLLQAFVGVSVVMSLVLAALASERRQSEMQLRRLAVSDALTGLANYRQLISVLDSEIARAERTGRSFAVLFMDLDRLKSINDRFGHVEGSRALCRVAEAIQGVLPWDRYGRALWGR